MQCLGVFVLCVYSEGEFKLQQVQRTTVHGFLDLVLPLDNDGSDRM